MSRNEALFFGLSAGTCVGAVFFTLVVAPDVQHGIAHRACAQMGYTRGELDSNWHVICEQETVTGDVTTVTRFKLGAQR